MNNGLSLDDPDDDGIRPEELITDRNMKAAVLALAKKYSVGIKRKSSN